MVELRLKAEGIFKLVVLVNDLCLNDADLTAAVRKVNEALVPQLELAFQLTVVAIRNQVRLSKRRVRLHAKLRRRHHRAEETLRCGLRELLVCAQGRQRDSRESLRRDDARKSLSDLALHLLDVLLHRRLARLDSLRALRVLNQSFLHLSLSSFTANLRKFVVL